MREYATLKALRRGETIDLEGILLKQDEGEIEVGDLYVAERNTGPKLLTAGFIDETLGWIRPTRNAYPFDIGECVKVCEVK